MPLIPKLPTLYAPLLLQALRDLKDLLMVQSPSVSKFQNLLLYSGQSSVGNPRPYLRWS